MTIEELKQAYMEAHGNAVIKLEQVAEAEKHLGDSQRDAYEARVAAEKALLIYACAVGIPSHRISLFVCKPSDIEGIVDEKRGNDGV